MTDDYVALIRETLVATSEASELVSEWLERTRRTGEDWPPHGDELDQRRAELWKIALDKAGIEIRRIARG